MSEYLAIPAMSLAVVIADAVNHLIKVSKDPKNVRASMFECDLADELDLEDPRKKDAPEGAVSLDKARKKLPSVIILREFKKAMETDNVRFARQWAAESGFELFIETEWVFNLSEPSFDVLQQEGAAGKERFDDHSLGIMRATKFLVTLAVQVKEDVVVTPVFPTKGKTTSAPESVL